MMRRFNNIIANQNDYDQLKYYLENNNTPPPDVKSKARFIRKYEGFVKQGNKIIYQPLNLEVIPFEEKEDKLREIFENDEEKPLTTKNNNVVQFYASELLLWDGGNNGTEITMDRALQLNKITRNENDIIY